MPEPVLPPRRLREAATWVAVVLVTGALAIAAGLGGLVAGVFGLSAAALVVVLLLLLLAAVAWRRAALALAVVGLALALGTVWSTLEPVRFDRSVGLLEVAPTAAAEVDGADLRRGLGSVFVDLRGTRAWRPGQRIRLKARSDAGRVVVALPMDRCFDVRLRAQGLAGDQEDGASLVYGLADVLGGRISQERWQGGDATWPGSPFDADAVNGSNDAFDQLMPVGNGISLFGRSFARRYDESGIDDPVVARRHSADAGAIRLDLDLQAVGPIVVASMPDEVGPMTPAEETWTSYGGANQVSDAAWPRNVRLPVSPEEEDSDGRWRTDWSRHRDQLARWQRWERRVTQAAAAQARRLAGPCADEGDRRNAWVTVRYGLRFGNGDGHVRVISVNADGEVWVGGQPGSELASPSRTDLLGGNRRLSLIDARTAGLRAQELLMTKLGTNG